MVDGIVIGLIALSAVFGLIRGIVSQIMALLGLVGAYFLAPPIGVALGSVVQEELGSSRFMAEKASVFLVGLCIYLLARLAGYGIEKLFINRVRELWKLNRVGGAALGIVKTTAIVAVIFSFVALVPRKMIGSWSPRLLESKTYQIAAKYNPMGDQNTLERMRAFRLSVMDPKKQKALKNDPALRELLSRHELKTALNDERFLKAVEQGDFDHLRKNERVEELMQDEELTALLAQLDQAEK